MSFKYSLTKITLNEFKQMPNLNITYGSTDSKFGKCLMGIYEDNFCFVYFGDYDSGFKELTEAFPDANLFLNDTLIKKKVQLFDPNASDDIKLLFKGTDFEMRIWEHLVYIPRGKTTSYEEVAKGIGYPKSIRAVANAIAKNKIAFFVPCHRVVSKNGSLIKFKWGVEIKRKMLTSEREIAKKRFLDLFLEKQSRKRLKEKTSAMPDIIVID